MRGKSVDRMRHDPRADDGRVDATAAALLLCGTVMYLSSLPHNLGVTDESYFLYEAKRIREGEVSSLTRY
jgi:hypothetical protein